MGRDNFATLFKWRSSGKQAVCPSPDASPEATVDDRKGGHDEGSEVVHVPVREDAVKLLNRALLRPDPRFPVVHLRSTGTDSGS